MSKLARIIKLVLPYVVVIMSIRGHIPNQSHSIVFVIGLVTKLYFMFKTLLFVMCQLGNTFSNSSQVLFVIKVGGDIFTSCVNLGFR